MRLIDADKVVEYCCGYFGHCTQECIKCGFANSVKDIPTAFDVDRVIEELEYEKLGDYTNDRFDRGFNGAIDMCIDIIKSGGGAND